jgi:hypothetical protein
MEVFSTFSKTSSLIQMFLERIQFYVSERPKRRGGRVLVNAATLEGRDAHGDTEVMAS